MAKSEPEQRVFDGIGGKNPPKLRPDIYIGLVGAAGTDLAKVKSQLKAQLSSYDYDVIEIKVSKLIAEFLGISNNGVPEDDRIVELMNGGDKIRRATKSGAGVISLVCNEIMENRQPEQNLPLHIKGSTAFIIDSLKNPAEIRDLDKIYGRNYYTVSVYSEKETRIESLATKLAKTDKRPLNEEHRARAKKVIDEDEHRDSSDLSQDVLNTFPEADFFVDLAGDVERQAIRFVDLVFGDPFKTPTLDEYFMFLAKASALRSCDLSRQVGAVIADTHHRAVISTGCNEVPYPGGGMFYEGITPMKDNRDHTLQYDPNASQISRTLSEILSVLKSAKMLNEDFSEADEQELTHQLLHGDLKENMSDSRIRNLIEFGRVVHAEMHALTEAAKLGRSVFESSLYCTTFPCHICARHIIAAGIKEVIYIEPYPKSLTKQLYKSEIATDGVAGSVGRPVVFRPFFGIAPVLFRRVFSFRKRKSGIGTTLERDRSEAIPLGAVEGVNSVHLEIYTASKVDEIRTICTK